MHCNFITDIHFNSENGRLITSSYDGKVKMWNFSKLDEEPALIKGHSEWVYCLAFSKKSSMVISGSADKSILITKIDINELKTIIRNKITGNKNMSLYNWKKFIVDESKYSEELPD